MSIWIKLLMWANVAIYRLTRGGLGSRMAGQSVLLLHTVGRRSGRRLTTPVNYYARGADFVLVASNWGKPRHPDWYFNLLAHPETDVQVKRRTLRVHARQVLGEEREELWLWVKSLNPFYGRYQSQTGRTIPIVLLEAPRATSDDPS